MRVPFKLFAFVVVVSAVALAGCDLLDSSSPGERLWRKLCADCHGLDASGNTVLYMGNPWADLRDDNWKYGGGDSTTVEELIRQGIFGQMPPHDELTPDQMRDLLDYFYSLRGEAQ